MIKIFLFLFYFISTTIYTIDTSENSNESPVKHNLLWKVQKGNKKIYLLGSVHAGNAALYPLDTKIITAFEESDSLAVEVDIGAGERKIQEEVKMFGYYPPGKSIQDVIPKNLYNAINEKLKPLFLDIRYFSNIKPWLLALTLSGLLEKNREFTTNYGIDRYFLNLARDKKKIIELETSRYQLEIFNSAPLDMQILFLRESIEDNSFIKVDLKKALDFWKKGDEVSLEKSFITPITSAPDTELVMQVLFYERNLDMTHKIEELIEKDGICFVVVGVGHLIGKKGIIKLLDEKGVYHIEKL